MATSTSSQPKTPSRQKKAPVWEYFEYDGVLNKSFCSACKTPIGGQNPSNLEKHINTVHRGELANELEAKKKKKKEERESTTPLSGKKRSQKKSSTVTQYGTESEEHKSITNALAMLIVTTSTAISIVTSDAFDLFCQRLNSKYNAPERTAMGGVINGLFLEMKAIITNLLQKTRSVDLRLRFCTISLSMLL